MLESEGEDDGNPDLWFEEGYHVRLVNTIDMVDQQFGQCFNCTYEEHRF